MKEKKWQRFAQEYLIDLNATQAAIRAGYSPRSAYSQGARLLRNARVQAIVQAEMAKRAQRTEITQDRVLQEIAKIAFADIKDYLKFRPVKVKVGEDKDGRPIYEHRQEVVIKPSAKVDGAAIAEVSISPKGVFTFRLHDKTKNLELLARHLGLLQEPINVTVNVNLAERVKAARERVKALAAKTNTTSDSG